MQKIKKLWLEKKGHAIIMRLSDTVDRRHLKWAFMEIRLGSDLVLHPDDFQFYNPNGRQKIDVLKKERTNFTCNITISYIIGSTK